MKTPGAVQQLLNQACTPLTMVASVGLLKKRYHLMQWAGAAAIMAGVYVVMAPRLTKGLNAGEDGTEAGDQVGLCEALDLILRLIGVRSYFHVDHTELPSPPRLFLMFIYLCHILVSYTCVVYVIYLCIWSSAPNIVPLAAASIHSDIRHGHCSDVPRAHLPTGRPVTNDGRVLP